jgi:hypothetical protein
MATDKGWCAGLEKPKMIRVTPRARLSGELSGDCENDGLSKGLHPEQCPSNTPGAKQACQGVRVSLLICQTERSTVHGI